MSQMTDDWINSEMIYSKYPSTSYVEQEDGSLFTHVAAPVLKVQRRFILVYS